MYVIITNLAILLVLFGNKPKKFDFIHQTVSCWEVHAGTRLILLSGLVFGFPFFMCLLRTSGTCQEILHK